MSQGWESSVSQRGKRGGGEGVGGGRGGEGREVGLGYKKGGLHGDVGYLLRVTHGNRPADDSPPLYQPHKACTLTPCTAARARRQFCDFKCRFFHTAPTQISHQDAHARHPKGGGRAVVVAVEGGQDDSHINDNTPPPHVPITHRRRTYHLDSTHILSTSWGTSHRADSRTALLSRLMGTGNWDTPPPPQLDLQPCTSHI